MGKRGHASLRTADVQLSVELTRVLRYNANPEEQTPKLLDGCGGLYPLSYLRFKADRLNAYDDSSILEVVANKVRRSGCHRFMALIKDGEIWVGLVSEGEIEHEFNLMDRSMGSSGSGA